MESIRRDRMTLIRELRHTDMKELLETPQLKHVFTQYQKDEILSRKVAIDRVGKCLDIVEAKGNEACYKLKDAVEQLSRLKLSPGGHPRRNSLTSSPNDSRSPSRTYAPVLFSDMIVNLGRFFHSSSAR